MSKISTEFLETWQIYPEFSETAKQNLEREHRISDSSKILSFDTRGRVVSVQAGQMNHEFQAYSHWDGEAWVLRRPELHISTLEEASVHHKSVMITFLGAGGSTSKSIPLTIKIDLTPNEARELSRALLNTAADIDPQNIKEE